MNNPVELLNQIKNSLIFFQNLKNISMMKILNHSLHNQTTNSSKLTLCLVARGRGGPKPEQACKKKAARIENYYRQGDIGTKLTAEWDRIASPLWYASSPFHSKAL